MINPIIIDYTNNLCVHNTININEFKKCKLNVKPAESNK